VKKLPVLSQRAVYAGSSEANRLPWHALGQEAGGQRCEIAQARVAANGLPVVQQGDWLAIRWYLNGAQ
jgi:hypothetical protein